MIGFDVMEEKFRQLWVPDGVPEAEDSAWFPRPTGKKAERVAGGEDEHMAQRWHYLGHEEH